MILLLAGLVAVAPAELLRQEHVDAARLASMPADASLDALIAALDDPWTRTLDAAEAAAFLREATFQPHDGVGLPELLSVDLDPTRRLPIVVTPMQGSPAARAGLRPRDVIVALDGESTQGMPWALVMRHLRERQPVLTIEHRGEVRLKRERIVPPVKVRSVLWLGVLRVRVRGFSAQTEAGVGAALAKAPTATVELDLRANPGGSLASALAVAGLFCGKRPVARMRTAHGDVPLEANGARVSHGRVTVLVDEGTASAAELLAAALAACANARVLGGPTMDKCLVHKTATLPDGGMLLFTSGRLEALDGADLCAQR